MQRRIGVWGWFCAVVILGLELERGGSVRGDVLAAWNFNDSNLGVDVGSGTLTTTFPAGDVEYFFGTTKNGLPGVSAGQSLSLKHRSNNGVGVLDFALDTTGYEGLHLSFASQGTATGFSSNRVQYSTDGGGAFADWGAPFDPPTSFDIFNIAFTGASGLDNNPRAVIRIRFDGATSSTGNNRIDNLTFSATPAALTAAPEPSSGCLALLSVALLSGGRWMRGRLAARAT